MKKYKSYIERCKGCDGSGKTESSSCFRGCCDVFVVTCQLCNGSGKEKYTYEIKMVENKMFVKREPAKSELLLGPYRGKK